MQIGQQTTRQKFILYVIAFLLFGLWIKTGNLQFLNHERFSKRALNQYMRPVKVDACRGSILDRNGVKLAESIPAFSYGLNPKKIKNSTEISNKLSCCMGVDPKALETRFASQKGFFWVIRQSDLSVSEKIDSINVSGLEKVSEFKRYYPLGKIGAQVIGYTDFDGRGIEGCEFFFDSELSGMDGKKTVFRDGKGRSSESLDKPVIETQDGFDIVLTIDSKIQEITDEELELLLERTKARWAGAIVMNTSNGEILAMSNAPLFDPNAPEYFDSESFNPAYRRNRLVTDMLEPGSTFKIGAFAEALESGTIDENTMINCENGKMYIAGHTINDVHKLGVVPAKDVLIESSNIGTVKIAEMIGKQRLYTRLRLLGFGVVTGSDFPNETSGNLPNPNIWSKLSLPTISFGQGVAVSPLQLSAAYASIANGGLLVRPHIVKEVKGENGTPGRVASTMTIRRTMSKDTADRLTKILCAVVDSGTGVPAAIPNVKMAGKTGTAQRIKEGGVGYIAGMYVSSFIGYVADREPRILCLVMVDSPEGVYYGSQIAGPVFKSIINRILNMGNGPYSSNPEIAENGTVIETAQASTFPGIKSINLSGIMDKVKKLNIISVSSKISYRPQEKYDQKNNFENGSPKPFNDIVTVEQDSLVRIPDVFGKTIRDAVNIMVLSNIKICLRGSGKVVEQNPPAGSLIPNGAVCELICKR